MILLRYLDPNTFRVSVVIIPNNAAHKNIMTSYSESYVSLAFPIIAIHTINTNGLTKFIKNAFVKKVA